MVQFCVNFFKTFHESGDMGRFSSILSWKKFVVAIQSTQVQANMPQRGTSASPVFMKSWVADLPWLTGGFAVGNKIVKERLQNYSVTVLVNYQSIDASIFSNLIKMLKQSYKKKALVETYIFLKFKILFPFYWKLNFFGQNVHFLKEFSYFVNMLFFKKWH